MCAFIDTLISDGFAVETICTVLGDDGCQVAARTYRSWKQPARPVAGRAVDDAIVVDALWSPADNRRASTGGGR